MSVSDSWNDSDVVNFCVCVCCLLSPFLLFVGVYYFTTIKIYPRTEKKYPHREQTTPFPTRPVFLTPDRTDPRFKQNMAPWPESGRGCTVRSGNPRRSGVPRSSLSPMLLWHWPAAPVTIAAGYRQLSVPSQLLQLAAATVILCFTRPM